MVGSGRGIYAGWIVLEQRERHYLPSTFSRSHRRVGIVERPVLSDCHQALPCGGHAPHPLGTLTAEDHLVVGDPGPADPIGRAHTAASTLLLAFLRKSARLLFRGRPDDAGMPSGVDWVAPGIAQAVPERWVRNPRFPP
jgi:hypothetical protein